MIETAFSFLFIEVHDANSDTVKHEYRQAYR